LLSTQSFPVVYSRNPRACTSGTFSASVTVGPNNTTVPRTIAFSLAADEGPSHSDDPFYVSLAAAQVATKSAVPATTGQPTVAGSSSPVAVTKTANWSGYSTTAETNNTTVTVKAGDSVTVTLWQVSSTAWRIDLNDNTNGESFTTPPEKYSGPGSTAEWIVEATTRCLGGTTRCVTSGLAPFTPAVAFSNLGMTGTEGALEENSMVQRGGTVSTPTTLTAAGFSVAYTGQQVFARPAAKTP
jgi:hypothetical protein